MPDTRSKSTWEIKAGSGLRTVFRRDLPLPADEVKLTMSAAFDGQVAAEFQVYRDKKPHKWYIIEMPPAKKNDGIEVSFALGPDDNFVCRGNVKEIGSLSDHYDELLARGDYYGILGVSENALQQDIKYAYNYKNSKYKSSRLSKTIHTAYEFVSTDDNRKRSYLKNTIATIFREWDIDPRHDENIPYLARAVMESTGDYLSLKEKGKAYVREKVVEAEKKSLAKKLTIGDLDYSIITADEGREGTTISLTSTNLVTNEQENFQFPVPPNTRPDDAIKVEGRGYPHKYLPNVQGDGILTIKILPLDAYAVLEGLMRELRVRRTGGGREFIVRAIREEAHRQYDPAMNAGAIERKVIDAVKKQIGLFTVPLTLTVDEAREGMETSGPATGGVSVAVPAGIGDGDMVHVQGMSFVKVKVIPVDARAVLESLMRELRVRRTGGGREFIVRAIREEARRQYRPAMDVGTIEKKVANDVKTQIRFFTLPASLTVDEAREGVNSLKPGDGQAGVAVPAGIGDGDMVHVQGMSFVKVKVIPVDARAVLEDIKRELEVSRIDRDQEFIVRAIREKARLCYNASVGAGAIGRRVADEIQAQIRDIALPVPLTGDEAREGSNIQMKADGSSLSIKVPAGCKDGDMVHIKELYFIEARVIPVDARAIFEEVIKKGAYPGDSNGIVEAVRCEVKGQYQQAGLAGIDKRKVIENIRSVLPVPVPSNLTFKEAAFGCTKHGTMADPKCSTCGGKGFYIEKGRHPAIDAIRRLNPRYGVDMTQDLRVRKCGCQRAISVRVPPLKTLLVDHVVAAGNGTITIKSQLERA